MDTSADANRRQEERARGPADRPRPGGGLRRRLLLAGAAVCLAAAGLLAAKYLHAPSAAREPSGAPVPLPATVEELRDEAFAVVRQLIADYPRSADAVSLMGTVHFAFKEPEEAEKWWYKGLEFDPKRVGNCTVLARAASIRGDLDAADRLWRQAQALAPDKPGVYSGHAAVLLRTGKPDDAIAALQKELALSPGDPQCFALLGKAYLQRQECEKAVEHYERALALGLEDRTVPLGLASAYTRLGRQDKAGECLRNLHALDEAQRSEMEALLARECDIDRARVTVVLARTLDDVGKVYAGHGNLSKAEASWRRGAAVDPKNRGCRLDLLELCASDGRTPEALDVCEELRAIPPRIAAVEMRAAELLAALRRFDEAEQAVRSAIDLEPKVPAGYRMLARLLMVQNVRLPEAKAWAAKLVALEPSAANCVLLAEACRRAGDLPGERAAVERALQLEPGNEMARRAYRALEEKK